MPINRHKVERPLDTRITHARLLELLHYAPETGVFRHTNRKVSTKVAQRPGCVSGPRTARTLRIHLDYRTYPARQLAWFYVHGVWHEGHLSHVDGDHLNLRINNLCKFKSVPTT